MGKVWGVSVGSGAEASGDEVAERGPAEMEDEFGGKGADASGEDWSGMAALIGVNGAEVKLASGFVNRSWMT